MENVTINEIIDNTVYYTVVEMGEELYSDEMNQDQFTKCVDKGLFKVVKKDHVVILERTTKLTSKTLHTVAKSLGFKLSQDQAWGNREKGQLVNIYEIDKSGYWMTGKEVFQLMADIAGVNIVLVNGYGN